MKTALMATTKSLKYVKDVTKVALHVMVNQAPTAFLAFSLFILKTENVSPNVL
jgi:hypothetical protein